MICQVCKKGSRFAPAVAMCPYENHKDGVVDQDVLAAMRNFLKTFDPTTLDAAVVVGRTSTAE